jgi:hypothetical protein
MSHLFYAVKRPLSNGFRPGEQHRADEFAGCDLNWLIESGAVEGIGTYVAGMPMMVAPPNTDDPNALKSEIIRLQQQNHMLATGQTAAAQFHSPTVGLPPMAGTAIRADPFDNSARPKPPETMEQARQLQAAQAAAAEQIRQENVVPVRRNPGQMETVGPSPVPTQRPPLYPDRPVAVSFDHSALIKRIDESRDAIIDEIRRYHTDGQTDGQDEQNVRHKFSNDEIMHLQSDLKAAQDAAADYKRQLDELRSQQQVDQSQPAPEPDPTSMRTPPKPEPIPAPRQTASRKGPEKPVK